MKRLFTFALLVILNLKSFGQYKAPNDRTNGAAAPIAAGIVVGVAGLITAGILYDRYIETIELDATEYFLQSGLAPSAFKLELLPNQVSSFKDLSNTSILAFAITESVVNYKAETIEGHTNKIMLMYVHDGWITEGGINFAYVTTELLNYDDWKKLYLAYLNLTLTKPIEDPSNITVYEKVNEKVYNAFTGEKQMLFNSDTYTTAYYVKFSTTVDLRGPFYHTDRALLYPRGSFEDDYLLIAPKIRLADDEYLTSPFDDQTILVYNEGKLGLFKKDFNRLVQLSNVAIDEINTFLIPRK
jgi:hypothetical protein